MNYNCIKSLNVRAKTTELLEENASVNFRDIELGKAFLAGTPKIQATKEKIDEMDIDRIKNCYASKDTVKKVKRAHGTGENFCQPRIWEGTCT